MFFYCVFACIVCIAFFLIMFLFVSCDGVLLCCLFVLCVFCVVLCLYGVSSIEV